MDASRYVGILLAGAVLAGGCADIEDVPLVIRDALKNVPYVEGSVISCLREPVGRGYLVTFHDDEANPIAIPGDGYLVWIDENNGVRWPHMAKLVWVPKSPDLAHRILKQGVLPSTFRIRKPDDTPLGRTVWNTL